MFIWTKCHRKQAQCSGTSCSGVFHHKGFFYDIVKQIYLHLNFCTNWTNKKWEIFDIQYDMFDSHN